MSSSPYITLDSPSPGSSHSLSPIPSFSGPLTDEQRLLKLGYKQEFNRALHTFDAFAASLSTVGFVSGVVALFGYGVASGGPRAMLWNWTLVGTMACLIALFMSEICSAYPVSGGIYYWSGKLGGPRYGPLIAWLTGFWNFVGWAASVSSVVQQNTLFLLSIVQIWDQDTDLQLSLPLQFGISFASTLFICYLNVHSQRVIQLSLRLSTIAFLLQYLLYLFWMPFATPKLNTTEVALNTFINATGYDGPGEQIYVWLIGLLYPSFVFYGYEVSSYLSEETVDAQQKSARGIWTSVLTSFVLSLPQLIVVLYSTPSFPDVVNSNYAQKVVVMMVQSMGRYGATTILVLQVATNIFTSAVNLLAGARIAFALSRDGILPYSSYFNHVDPATRLPIRAVYLTTFVAELLIVTVLFSSTAFNALASIGIVACTFSYLFPILARVTIGRVQFETVDHGPFFLGYWAYPLAFITILYIIMIFIVLMLPTSFPITMDTFNFSSPIVALLTIAIFMGWWLWGRHHYQGPGRPLRGVSKSVGANDVLLEQEQESDAVDEINS